jgi:amino acid transporter
VIDVGLGHAGSKVALTMVLIVSCTLAIQAVATRSIFSYARDEMIFGWSALSTVSPRFHAPRGAVVAAAVIPAAITLMGTKYGGAESARSRWAGSTSRSSSSCWRY